MCILKQWTLLVDEYGYDMTQIEANSLHALTNLFNIPSTCIESRNNILVYEYICSDQ